MKSRSINLWITHRKGKRCRSYSPTSFLSGLYFIDLVENNRRWPSSCCNSHETNRRCEKVKARNWNHRKNQFWFRQQTNIDAQAKRETPKPKRWNYLPIFRVSGVLFTIDKFRVFGIQIEIIVLTILWKLIELFDWNDFWIPKIKTAKCFISMKITIE